MPCRKAARGQCRRLQRQSALVVQGVGVVVVDEVMDKLMVVTITAMVLAAAAAKSMRRPMDASRRSMC